MMLPLYTYLELVGGELENLRFHLRERLAATRALCVQRGLVRSVVGPVSVPVAVQIHAVLVAAQTVLAWT